jgi:hypothetical protein
MVFFKRQNKNFDRQDFFEFFALKIRKDDGSKFRSMYIRVEGFGANINMIGVSNE